VAGMGGMRNEYNDFDGNPKGKRSVGRLGMRWEDNIKINLKEMIG
jgi:hypothetical protein